MSKDTKRIAELEFHEFEYDEFNEDYCKKCGAREDFYLHQNLEIVEKINEIIGYLNEKT